MREGKVNLETALRPTLKPLLARLPGLQKCDSQALSLYLPLKMEGYEAKRCALTLGHLLDSRKGRLSRSEQVKMESEAKAVLGRLNALRPSGWPGIAAFSEMGKGVWEWMLLPEAVEARLEWGEVLLMPLELLLRRHPASLVALIDKEEVRSLGVVLGAMQELGAMQGKDVKRHRSGDTMAAANQRKTQEAVKLNLRKAVEVISYEMDSGGYQRLFLGGPQEARAQFEKMLPKPLQDRISGYVSVALYSSNGQLLKDLREQMSGEGRAAKAM